MIARLNTKGPKAAASSVPVSSFTSTGRLLQRQCACGGTPAPSGERKSCREKKLQRRLGNLPSPTAILHPLSLVSEVPPIVHDVVSSPGRPLNPQTRAFMEPRFGHDFTRIRIHDDEKASESARAVDARAFTLGNHVVFATGQYS